MHNRKFIKFILSKLTQRTCPLCKEHTASFGVCDICDTALDTAILSEPLFVLDVGKENFCTCSLFTYDRNEVVNLLFILKKQKTDMIVNYLSVRIISLFRYFQLEGKTTLITNIPRSISGLQKYGYDQAAEVAKRISGIRSDITYANLLKRKRTSLEQKNLDYESRQKNISGKFKFRNNFKYNSDFNGNIIVFDDVMTTGASVTEAITILRKKFPFAKIYACFIASTKL